jgi:hypothetical protein
VTELYSSAAPISDLKPGSYDLNLTRVTFQPQAEGRALPAGQSRAADQAKRVIDLTFARLFINGPPLFPGWIGTDVCSALVSSLIPVSDATFPMVKFPEDDRIADNGKPYVATC